MKNFNRFSIIGCLFFGFIVFLSVYVVTTELWCNESGSVCSGPLGPTWESHVKALLALVLVPLLLALVTSVSAASKRENVATHRYRQVEGRWQKAKELRKQECQEAEKELASVRQRIKDTDTA
jgi:uncharacterized protein YlxW (UPF0749 family)